MPRTKPNLGITGPVFPSPDLYQERFLSQLDTATRPQKTILRLGHALVFPSDSEETKQLETTIWRSARERQIEVALLSVPLSSQTLVEVDSRLLRLHKRARAHSIELFFDFGKLGPPPSFERTFCVYDPVWFNEPPWSRYWKLHGWHEARWVRRYSSSQLRSVAESAKKFKPEFLILGHSQRKEQILELLSFL